MTPDERRSAHLLFAEELALGEVDAADLEHPAVQRAVRHRPVPSRLSRRLQERAQARGSLTYDAASAEPMAAAREAVLGERAAGPPRVLLRIGDLPHLRAGQDPQRHGVRRLLEVHALLCEYEVPHLVAVRPRVSDDPLQPEAQWRRLHDEELEAIAQLRRDGVAFALGGLDGRSTTASPGRASELAGLRRADLVARLDTAEGALRRHEVEPAIFSAPFERFDHRQYAVLAERYDVVCGGPATVGRMGFHATPLWRGNAVYAPAYPPLHGPAAGVRDAVARLEERRAALWVPAAIDWAAEDGDPSGLHALCAQLRGLARGWDEFLAAVRASGASAA
jgi:hypothetical protein